MAAVPASPSTARRHVVRDLLLVAVVVWAAARLGIWSRSSLELAVFWPANALLLGLFVRLPRSASVGGWAGAVVGYFAADLTTGGPLLQTAWLTAANLAGVVVGLGLLRRLDPTDQRLQRPRALVHLGLACCGAAGAAAVVGLYCGTEFFALDPVAAVRTWFSSELAMYLALLPVVLTWPDRQYWPDPPGSDGVDRGAVRALGGRLAPLPVLVAALALGQAIGGPGALAFGLPVLLWGALRGGVFETALLVLVANAWTLLALNSGHLDLAFDYAALTADSQVSVQLGLALTSLGPLMVAANTRARESALARMEERATRDGLTGVLSRPAFQERAEAVLGPRRDGALVEVSVLMIDLDHFKGINDRHGHAAGDRVLVAMADAVRGCLRSTDLIGRMGGEEFAVVIPGIPEDEAVDRAEQIRIAVGDLRVQTRHEDSVLAVTASIGVAHDASPAAVLDDLLDRADDALYLAKRRGRDRVVVAGAGRPPAVDGPGPR